MQINAEERTLSGILPVYKEKGFTSFDVVAKLRAILKIKKIGHTGTLDPDAEGVLPVCIGSATRLVEMLTDNRKTYEAGMLFGTTTDTQDISGKIIKQSAFESSEEEVINAVRSFEGGYAQIPPMYSALKVGGKKLCDLAREGRSVERKPRHISIYAIEITNMDIAGKKPCAGIKVTCSKGTYIRTLIHDIGEKLGCGACMEKLLRTEAAGFSLDDCLTLEEIENKIRTEGKASVIKPVEEVFNELPRVRVGKESERFLANGNKLYPDNFIDLCAPYESVRVCNANGEFKAVYMKEDDHFKVKYMFF